MVRRRGRGGTSRTVYPAREEIRTKFREKLMGVASEEPIEKKGDEGRKGSR